ncbi:hypothetical protein [Streptomyces sp. MAR4 CNX-425]|uniref:hypothetical protein n=1 Tax=Streptomyces sp. MAR4 CNX-425 TaxID=3406343 RepID=UPI003B50C43E
MLGGSMRVGRARARLGAAAAAAAVLVTGCGGGSGGEPERPEKRERRAESSPAAAEESAGTPDVAGADTELSPPTGAAAARRLIGEVIAVPEDFGPGVGRGDPYERDPDTWPVLNDQCIWQQQKYPDTVLATLTRRFEVPAADGKGPIQLSAIVTVHRDEHSARWEMATALEEGMRCPTQRLSATETLTDLLSSAFSPQDYTRGVAYESLGEHATYVNEATGGQGYPYEWQQKRLESVTFTVTGRVAGKGRTDEEMSGLMVQAMAQMSLRLEAGLEGGK